MAISTSDTYIMNQRKQIQ